jgi:nicotinate phosphoribosyltransferase
MYHPMDKDKSLDISRLEKEKLHEKVMENGKTIKKENTVEEIAEFTKTRLSKLPDEYKRFDNPHVYKVGISPELMKLRDTLRKNYLD